MRSINARSKKSFSDHLIPLHVCEYPVYRLPFCGFQEANRAAHKEGLEIGMLVVYEKLRDRKWRIAAPFTEGSSSRQETNRQHCVSATSAPNCIEKHPQALHPTSNTERSAKKTYVIGGCAQATAVLVIAYAVNTARSRPVPYVR